MDPVKSHIPLFVENACFAGTELTGGCDRYQAPVIVSTAASTHSFILICLQISK